MLLKKLKEKHDAMANTKLPPAEVAKLLKEQGELKKKLAKMEEEWLAASEQLATLEA